MASNYPGSLDSFDTIASDKKTSDAVGGRTHRAMHNDLGDAIESVQGELGTNPSGSDATVAARLTAIEAGTNLGAGSVGSTQLADGAVTAAKLASGVVPKNLLTANQSSLETDTTGWVANNSNVTIARSTDQARVGSASLKVTSNTASSTTKRARISTRVPVTAGTTYTVVGSILTDGTAQGRLNLLWYDAASGGTNVAVTTPGLQTASAGWVDDRIEVVAPVGATHLELNVYLDNAAPLNNFVYADRLGVWEGVGGDWGEGGSQITGSVGQAYTKTIYVDSAAGAAANPGTSALPCATLSQAVAIASACASVVKVKAPATSPLREVVYIGTGVPSLRVEPMVDGDPWHLYGSTEVTSGWSAAGGGVYSRAASVQPISGVWVTSLTETIGDRTFILTLDENTSTPTTPGEGQYGWASNVLYVKLPSSADPGSHTIEVSSAAGATITSDCAALELESAVLKFHNSGGVYATSGNITATDCVGSHGGNTRGIWGTNSAANMRLTRCYGWRSANDGFNVHGSGKTLLVDCDGSYNDDEGASAHDTATMTVVGGRYAYNVQSGIGSVGSSVNIVTGDAQLVGNARNGSSETTSAGLMIYETATVQVSGVTAQDNNGSGVRIEATATILGGLDGIKSGTGAGNDLADNYAA